MHRVKCKILHFETKIFMKLVMRFWEAALIVLFEPPQMDHTQVTNINEVVKSHWKLKCSTLIYPEILCWKLPQFLSCVPRIPSNFVNLVCIFNCSEKYSDSIKRIFTCVFWNIWLAVSFFWNKVRVFCILSLFPFA